MFEILSLTCHKRFVELVVVNVTTVVVVVAVIIVVVVVSIAVMNLGLAAFAITNPSSTKTIQKITFEL